MYDHMRTVGQWVAIYFCIIVIFGGVLMTKMFSVLFINNVLDSKNLKKLLKKKNFFAIISNNLKEKFHKKPSIGKAVAFASNKHLVTNIL